MMANRSRGSAVVQHGFYARSRLSMLENLPVVNVDCFGGEPSAANP